MAASNQRLAGSTLRPKTYLDLLIERDEFVAGIELKVPLNGKHPETIYSFCADLEFLGSIKRKRQIQIAFSIMVTNDSAFWRDSGRGSLIHNRFRSKNQLLSGRIEKPTGLKDSCLMLEGSYATADQWQDVDPLLMPRGRYLLVEV